MPEKKSTEPSRKNNESSTANLPDDRVRRSKEKVLEITFQLLTESGLGVSIDEVSRCSGVAKTTIYRHWPTRSDLILDACTKITVEQQVPDTGSFHADISSLVHNLAKLLNTARWTSVLPSIVDAAERDPKVAKIHRKIQLGHASPFRGVITRAQRRGELPKSIDPSVMTASLMGPLFYRRWFSREPIDDKFVKALIRNTMGKR